MLDLVEVHFDDLGEAQCDFLNHTTYSNASEYMEAISHPLHYVMYCN